MDGLVRIFARNCEIHTIESAEAQRFLKGNHRLGPTRCKFWYGLFVAKAPTEALPIGTLTAVAGFSGPRTWEKNGVKVRSYEWVRYASLQGLGIDGGMSKMLKAFTKEVQPDDVMSYADASWSDGDVYRKLGFKEEEAKVFADGSKSLKFRLKLTEYEE